MGDFLRLYWQPVLLSTELPAPDCAPVRVRLLGENLIAFRDTSGRVGLLGINCSHRGAPLFFGRNEEDGLRCGYHGWKYEVTGACVDMPNEPPPSRFKEKIQQVAYPCIDRGGLIWAYLGSQSPAPELPALEWAGVPSENRYLAKRMQYSNWVQALEGDIDQSHVSFAHRMLNKGTGRGQVDRIRSVDTHPRFSVVDTDYGVLIGAARDASDNQEYWRMTQFILPFWAMTGPYGENPTRQTRGWVPIDDENVMVYAVQFHPLRPLTESEIGRLQAGSGAGFVGDDNFLPPTTEAGGAWRPKPSMANDYHMDRERQKTDYFTGIPDFWAQDAAMQEGMGPSYDRSQEHLGTSDLGIMSVRQRLLRDARALHDQGVVPVTATDPSVYQVRGAAALLPVGSPWVEASESLRVVVPGVNPAGV